jgi:hypothetical protein
VDDETIHYRPPSSSLTLLNLLYDMPYFLQLLQLLVKLIVDDKTGAGQGQRHGRVLITMGQSIGDGVGFPWQVLHTKIIPKKFCSPMCAA